MDCGQVMTYYEAAQKMARTFAMKVNDSGLADDLTNDLLLDLHAADISNARGNVDHYVLGILWKSASSRLFYSRDKTRRERETSLDELREISGRSGSKQSYQNPDVAIIRELF